MFELIIPYKTRKYDIISTSAVLLQNCLMIFTNTLNKKIKV